MEMGRGRLAHLWKAFGVGMAVEEGKFVEDFEFGQAIVGPAKL